MTEIKQMEEQKRNDIHKAISELGCSIEKARKLLADMEDECMVEITAPQNEEIPLQYVTIQSTHTGHHSGKSYKPGNLILNIRKSVINSAVFVSSSAVSIGAISSSEPLIGIFTVITVIVSAAQLMEADLGENLSLLLASLWEDRSLYNLTVDIEEGFELMNKKLDFYGREHIQRRQYQELLDNMQNLRVIRLEEDKIILKEKVHISY